MLLWEHRRDEFSYQRIGAWPRLYVLVLMAVTTDARRGELLSLRWKDIDLERGEARIDKWFRSKNCTT